MLKRVKKIDIKLGKLTFGQRIELGDIVDKCKDNEVQVFKSFFKCLHNIDISLANPDIKWYVNYFNEICDGLAYWVEVEQKMLKYTPTTDERAAGIDNLNASIGHLGTLKALARNHGKSPDEVLNWEYGTVFGMLYADLQEYNYKERYRRIMENKAKR